MRLVWGINCKARIVAAAAVVLLACSGVATGAGQPGAPAPSVDQLTRAGHAIKTLQAGTTSRRGYTRPQAGGTPRMRSQSWSITPALAKAVNTILCLPMRSLLHRSKIRIF
jgi:hypothetical protein